MQLVRDYIKLLIVISTSQLQLVTQGGGRHSCAHIPEIAVSVGNSAILSVTLLMRTVAIVMCMLGAEAPATCLPEGAFLLNMIGVQLVALETVGKLGFAPLTPLA